MCGICGFVRFSRGSSEEDVHIIRKMNDRLFHRGPDAQDVLIYENVAFGFSRLSIIGLDNGMQPICNEDDSVILICNGEIFNYIELRKRLEINGHRFKTQSDVEVIVHLYEEQGISFLNELNGQFAFALYDKKKRELYCVRDQLGILPLYYSKVRNTFVFGSEIKAIVEHPLVSKDVDLVGLDQVFTFPGLVSPRTMFKNILSLENGHYLKIDDSGVVSNVEYWDLTYPTGEVPLNGKTEDEYVDELEKLFEASIKLRLRADVPSGLYLSGGLDSSMITMKVNQLYPQKRNEVFSIDFAESDLSETRYQKIVADASNSNLNIKTFFFEDISERLRKVIYHCECPLRETYNTASLSLSESTRAKGIKVILSGEGSDELFAGYVGYRFDKLRETQLIENQTPPQEEALREKIWGDRSFIFENDFLDLEAVKREIYSDHLNASFDEINCLNYKVVDKEKIAGRNILNRRLYLDYKLRLVDHLVADHGDRMAMANSVEVRYPFLDKNFVEFSARMPTELKLKDFTEKYILKKLANRFVPRQVVEREKFGFVAPGTPYLLKKGVEYIDDILSYARIKRQGYFNPDKIENLKVMYKKEGMVLNVPYERDLLMMVLTFGILNDTFF